MDLSAYCRRESVTIDSSPEQVYDLCTWFYDVCALGSAVFAVVKMMP